MSRRRKHRLKLRSLYVWHRYIGLAAALFVLVLSVTGILLNHTERLGFDQQHVQTDLVLDWYGIHAPQTMTSFEVGTRRITLFGRHLYLDTLELPGEHQQLIGATKFTDYIVIAVDHNILLFSPQGELVERLGGVDGVPSGMRSLGIDGLGSLVVNGAHAIYRPNIDFLNWAHWEGDAKTIEWKQSTPLPGPLYRKLVGHYRGEVLPVERVLLDLHSGRIFGRYGVWAMDAAAVLLILLTVTGTWMWLRRRR